MANLSLKLRLFVTSHPLIVRETKMKAPFIYLLVDTKGSFPLIFLLDVNPREPKMTTSSSPAAVVEPETDFYISNRGIVITRENANL